MGALDSACNRTCAGETWVRNYIEELRAKAPPEIQALLESQPEAESFRFGNGGTLPSGLRHRLPAVMAGRVVCFWVSAVPVESLGLLIGRDLLDSFQGVLDFSARTLTFGIFDSWVQPLNKLTAGHLA